MRGTEHAERVGKTIITKVMKISGGKIYVDTHVPYGSKDNIKTYKWQYFTTGWNTAENESQQLERSTFWSQKWHGISRQNGQLAAFRASAAFSNTARKSRACTVGLAA